MLPTVNLGLVLVLPFLAGIGVPLASGIAIAMVVYIQALISIGGNAAANAWRSRSLAVTIGFVGSVCIYGFLVAGSNRLPLGNVLEYSLRLALIVIAYVVGVQWVRRGDPRPLVVLVTLCCVAFSGSGIAFKLAGAGVEVGDTIRYRGFAATINNLALYSALGVITSLYLFLGAHVDSGNRRWLLAMVVCGAGLLASGSLGPMLAVVAGVLVLVHGLGRFSLKTLLIAGVGGIALLLLAYVGSDDYLIGRISGALETNLAADRIGDPENSIEWRILHWNLLLQHWWAEFAWFGAGLGQQAELSVFRTMTGDGYAAHNDFIGLLIELGLIGFAVVGTALCWALTRDVFRLPLTRSVTALFVVAGLSAPTIATGAVQYYAPLLFAACAVESRRRSGGNGQYGVQRLVKYGH